MMRLYPLEYFRRRSIQAEDGEIGRCVDFLIDRDYWAVRYAVVDTRKWLPGRKVVISPIELGHREPLEEHGRLKIKLTRDQIRESPPLDEHAPVSKLLEQRLAAYYGWPTYWEGAGLWGGSQTIPILPPERFTEGPPPTENTPPPGEDVPLHSAHDLAGYLAVAEDGDVGQIVDAYVDTRDWTVPFFLVKTSKLPESRSAVMPASRIGDIRVIDRVVKFDADRAYFANRPEYDTDEPVPAERAEAWSTH